MASHTPILFPVEREGGVKPLQQVPLPQENPEVTHHKWCKTVTSGLSPEEEVLEASCPLFLFPWMLPFEGSLHRRRNRGKMQPQ